MIFMFLQCNYTRLRHVRAGVWEKTLGKLSVHVFPHPYCPDTVSVITYDLRAASDLGETNENVSYEKDYCLIL